MPHSSDDRASLAAFALESPAPLYARVKDIILQQIRTGVWGPNFKLPSESELFNQLGVSRMTINRALRELTIEGVLVRLQGVGTFVAELKGHAALFQIHDIAEEITKRGHQHRSDVVLLEALAGKTPASLPFSLDEVQDLFHSVLVHYENDIPVQIEERFVNADIAPDYLQQDFTRITPFAYLMQLAPLTEAEHMVEAIHATPAECKLLHIKRTDPCLLIRRRSWSGKRQVGCARLIYPGSRYRLEGRFGQ
ncbi:MULTISPECIES: histidine utilization repressor [Pseudomonas]|uniref:Histidine utilization repressor n=1 Tax=Pseudomonas guariconensis TaxID=1288410 RepID=A0AAX0VZ39_9PSED|nr:MULTISPECIES: histidine utilization repressor [Pseudomonas]MCO7623026.1 histidine utilization repressor [Pseudomonas guariconensis]MDM9594599.1 histidine utilization repressor [Pseudomonas guariconensis]MDM9607429.1 histidine utilization repressor [Pseudomonas guariconensis]MDM9612385.1 histidine utilization repressor [Pseudomonas guariconensis]MEB3840775.1 histidine utilization repressor [Pseudomonas guariconensis]